MKITLKDDALQNLLMDIVDKNFTVDGCSCGSYAYKLESNFYLYAYRSCRRSNYTPDDKLWHIDTITFYSKATFIYSENYKGVKFIEEIEVDDDNIIDGVELNQDQLDIIYSELRRVSHKECGQEFRV